MTRTPSAGIAMPRFYRQLCRMSAMKSFRYISSATATGICLIGVAALGADWPHWRGPTSSGSAPDRTLPIRWSLTENIAWKAPIAGAGVSTPIVSGDRVYVTSQIGAGVRRQGNHPRLVQGADAAAQGERALTVDTGGAGTVVVIEAFGRAGGQRIWARRTEAAGG